MKIKKVKTSHKKKNAIFAITCVMATISMTGLYLHFTSQNPIAPPETGPQQSANHTIVKPGNNDSVQSEPQAENFNNKAAPATDRVQTNQRDQGRSSAQMTASATLTDDSLLIRGGINNAAVTDGRCFVRLTSPGGQTTEYSTELLRNAATTDCKTIIIPRSQLPKGNWKVTLHYSSQSLEGVSDAHTITIN